MALGATDTETWFKISIPAAKSGIAAGIVLGIGRDIGEAMAVMMVAGNSPNMPDRPFRLSLIHILCVDLEGVGITRPNLTGLPTVMVRSYWELGDILHFDPDTCLLYTSRAKRWCWPAAEHAAAIRWACGRL